MERESLASTGWRGGEGNSASPFIGQGWECGRRVRPSVALCLTALATRPGKAGDCARRRWHSNVAEFRGEQDDAACGGGTAQVWIAEGGRLRASSSCLLSLCWWSHFESSQVRRAPCTTGLLTVGSDASESGSVAFSFGQGDMTRWQRLDGALRRCSFFTLLLFVGLQVTAGRCCH